MEQNYMDVATDKIKERMGWLEAKLHKDFKHVNKFRQEPVPKSLVVNEYLNMSPDDLTAIFQRHIQFYTQKQQELLATGIPQEELHTPEELAREDVNEWMFEMEEAAKDKRLAVNRGQ